MAEKISAIVVCAVVVAIVAYALFFSSSRGQQIRNEQQAIVMELDAEVKKQEEERWRVQTAEADKYYHQKFALQKQKQEQLRQQQEHRLEHGLTKEQRFDTIYADMLREGAIYSMNIEFNEVRIDPIAWTGLDLKTKRVLVMSFSAYFDLKGSTKRVTVYSSYNDTKLATYGSWGGLKILL